MHILSQFMQTPREEHMSVAYKVLGYMKGTIDCGILLHAHSDLHLSAYYDSHWGTRLLARLSLTGYW